MTTKNLSLAQASNCVYSNGSAEHFPVAFKYAKIDFITYSTQNQFFFIIIKEKLNLIVHNDKQKQQFPCMMAMVCNTYENMFLSL